MCRGCRRFRMYGTSPDRLRFFSSYGSTPDLTSIQDPENGLMNMIEMCLFRIKQALNQLEVVTGGGRFTLQELGGSTEPDDGLPQAAFVREHLELARILIFEFVSTSSFKLGTELNEAKERFYEARGLFHSLNGDWSLAVLDLKEAMKLSRVNEPKYFLALASAYLRMGAPARAYNALKTRLEDSRLSDRRAHVSEVLEKMRTMKRELEETHPRIDSQGKKLILEQPQACYVEPDLINRMLPNELLEYIFVNLTDIEDIRSVTSVSRKWRDIGTSSGCCKLALQLRIGPGLTEQLVKEQQGNPTEALRVFLDSVSCWKRLSVLSKLRALLKERAFADLYGDANSFIHLVEPLNEAGERTDAFLEPEEADHGKLDTDGEDDDNDPDTPEEARRYLRDPFTYHQPLPIYLLPKRRRGALSKPIIDNYSTRPKLGLPASLLLHYHLQNGAMIHLEAEIPPFSPTTKDGTGNPGRNDFTPEEELLVDAFPNFDFLFFPLTSAGVREWKPEDFTNDFMWYFNSAVDEVVVGRQGPLHHISVSVSPKEGKLGRVTIFGRAGPDISLARYRAWPGYTQDIPRSPDRIRGSFPSFTHFLRRVVVTECEKDIYEEFTEILDRWNISAKSGNASSTLPLLSEQKASKQLVNLKPAEHQAKPNRLLLVPNSRYRKTQFRNRHSSFNFSQR